MILFGCLLANLAMFMFSWVEISSFVAIYEPIRRPTKVSKPKAIGKQAKAELGRPPTQLMCTLCNKEFS